MKTKEQYKKYFYSGVEFRITYAKPNNRKKSEHQYRGLVTPIHANTGKKLTKHELGTKDSKEPVNYPVYGKSVRDIYENKLPDVAAVLIDLMYKNNVLAPKIPINQLCLFELSQKYKEDIFAHHSNEWSDATIKKYKGQYAYMAKELKDILPSQYTQDMYEKTKDNIINSAKKNMRATSSSVLTEDNCSSSAKARIHLLNLFLRYLQETNKYDLHINIKAFKGKQTNTAFLLDLLESARLYPKEAQKVFTDEFSCKADICELLLLIALDTGLRHSELFGLLWGSLQSVDGSQGLQWYLQISGQMDRDTAVRREHVKSVSGFRCVPLSQELGVLLQHKKDLLRAQFGDIETTLMVAQKDGASLVCTKESLLLCDRQFEELFAVFAKKSMLFERLKEKRDYTFLQKTQDEHLKKAITIHSMRRNFCTMQHIGGAFTALEIYEQMGHSSSGLENGKRSSGARGKTSEELYAMCLKKQLARSMFHCAGALHYTAGSGMQRSELPSCGVTLTIPPHAKVKLTVHSTVPNNKVSVSTTDKLAVKQDASEAYCFDLPRPEAVLASDRANSIVSVRYPFDHG